MCMLVTQLSLSVGRSSENPQLMCWLLFLHFVAQTPAPTSLIPGIVIGSNGVYHPSDEAASSDAHPHPHPDPLAQWGLNLSSTELMDGLSPWVPNPAIDDSKPPLSPLGHFADQIYKFGPLDLATYTAQLREFISVAFPDDISVVLDAGLDVTLDEGLEGKGGRQAWDSTKIVWQTDKNNDRADIEEVQSWHKAEDEGWKWDLVTDE